jgi:hypothetical protein
MTEMKRMSERKEKKKGRLGVADRIEGLGLMEI